MLLTRLEVTGFKSFAKKAVFDFDAPVVSIVGPNGSGKSNVAEAIRFVLGEQSMKSMRGKRGEDLIWNGSTSTPRANRASVAIAFNNTSRFLNVDFDEVLIERIVHRDGINEYRMNGTQVRLKDIQEILAGANIGESGHHIISQGEADKILAANPRDRRSMLEDALGLMAYQYKKEESQRKLEKTEENMRQVEALRREVAPHLRFLKKQVEKVERTEELRASGLERFKAYFAREDRYVKEGKARIADDLARIGKDVSAVTAEIQAAKDVLQKSASDQRASRIVELSRALDEVRTRRAEASRRASRIAGQLEALQKVTARASVPAEELSRLADMTESELGSQSDLVAFVRTLIGKIRALTQSASRGDVDLAALEREGAAAQNDEAECAQKEEGLARELNDIRAELESSRVTERDKERALFDLTGRERDLRHMISTLEGERDRLQMEEEEFRRDIAEVSPLIGHEVLQFKNVEADPLSREEQVHEKRELEKVKIRLEEAGVAGSADIMKEYQEASEREAFLEHEMTDLSASGAQLKELIVELESELSKRFDEGLANINSEFTRLFALMFDGGSASLTRVQEKKAEDGEEAVTEGIDISLTIPRKRIKSLVMLSGGERALTSIALIFAMSFVNPPPFLVLDETDAALDEANSRRYGDMVKGLSDKAQLVVITHNRETMSRAGILYGVTMGNDGVSKVLSVKLEEAVKVAK